MPKGWKGIIVREIVYNKAKTVYTEYKKEKPFVTFTEWINDVLWEVLEEQELSYKAPALQFIGLDQNVIYVKDHFIDRIVEVQVVPEGKFLYCRYCERDDCLHVGFCFAIREVNKVLVERGFKQPKGEVRKETNN
ncbi:MAG: hypothetical protein QXY85_06025 [Candidatus Nitrosocaldus sp.]